MRLTTRRLMLIVAAIAVGCMGVRGCLYVLDGLAEPFAQTIDTTQSWDLGPAPTVAVDCFAGGIYVMPARDGSVTARIVRVAYLADHQADADREVRTIFVQSERHEDTLRIVTRDGEGSECRRQTSVELWVPPNTSLDLRMGLGTISVGYDNRPGGATKVPVVSPSIRARNDAIHRSFATGGDITIAAAALPGGNVPVRLQLDAPGRIEVEADRATVEARTWHAAIPPDEHWAPGFEDGREGVIVIRGALVGENTVRAARGIELHLPTAAACRVEAEARNGGVAGNALPPAIPPQKGVTRWAGSIGEAPTVTLHLRADDGSILVDRSP